MGLASVYLMCIRDFEHLPPLCTCPHQGQANKWIKNMERDSGMDVVKLSGKDFLRTLENGVRFGRAVSLYDIGPDQIDASHTKY